MLMKNMLAFLRPKSVAKQPVIEQPRMRVKEWALGTPQALSLGFFPLIGASLFVYDQTSIEIKKAHLDCHAVNTSMGGRGQPPAQNKFKKGYMRFLKRYVQEAMCGTTLIHQFTDGVNGVQQLAEQLDVIGSV